MDSNHNNDRTPSSRWSLRGKKFVVTGGTKGIGKAVVQSLLSHGAYRIVVCSRSDIDYDAYIASVGIDPAQPSSRDTAGGTPVITHVTCDVSTKEGRQKLVNISKDMLNEDLGNDDSDPRCIHGLINNVGINVRKPILEQTEEEYHSMLRTNVDAAYFLCRDFSKHFVDTGDGATIVNVSSAAGVQSSGTGAAYGMSKAALNHFTRILACEWAHRSIRVNAVAPWMTMTPMLKDAVAKNPSQLDKVEGWTPMGRLASAEEVADPIVFLCLPASSYITGQVLGIDGGLTAQGFNGPTCER